MLQLQSEDEMIQPTATLLEIQLYCGLRYFPTIVSGSHPGLKFVIHDTVIKKWNSDDIYTLIVFFNTLLIGRADECC